jgi:hypothetical protein
LHANCYIPKPSDLADLVVVGKLIEAFWLQIVLLPSELDPKAPRTASQKTS